MSERVGRTAAVAQALMRLERGDATPDVCKFVQHELGYSRSTASKYVREALRQHFAATHELGGADTQDVRQKLARRLWDRSAVLHSKALICLDVGDEADTTPSKEAANIVERGAKLSAAALACESRLATIYHLDKIAPDYDLSSEETREFVAASVASNAGAFDTPDLLRLANAIDEVLATRPHLNREQHREAQASERIRALLESREDAH